jgi:hypothetical protein
MRRPMRTQTTKFHDDAFSAEEIESRVSLTSDSTTESVENYQKAGIAYN